MSRNQLPKINPTHTKAWTALGNLYKAQKDQSMTDLFLNDSMRVNTFSASTDGFYLDYSKNLISDEVRQELLNLADEVQLQNAIKAQLSGAQINETEGRAVGHTQLRNFDQMPEEVTQTLQRIKHFVTAVGNGDFKGYTGLPITHIVNVGIGGSDLGPDMVCEALAHYQNHLEVRFVSNVDGDHVHEQLKGLPAEQTLFVIVSKTFTTQETLTNAQTIRRWFLNHAPESAVTNHFAAVSTNLEAVGSFGIDADRVFPMWDWVGGRFSLWSAVGLSIALSVGYDHFEALLRGAHAMDQHFSTADFDQNMPVLMALISVWYNNFYNAESECIVPYSQYLNKFVAYLQQGIMESNGKYVDRNGAVVDYQTGTIVWGSTGTNAQHAFFQLIHQGTKLIPADFIAFKECLYGEQDHQNKLLANCIAQTQALMSGTQGQEIESPYRVFTGNKPTNTLLIDRLTPNRLGGLIALYEHKLFVQGVIWNIFSYDQWGVELGKKLAVNVLSNIESSDNLDGNPGDASGKFDASTAELLRRVKS